MLLEQRERDREHEQQIRQARLVERVRRGIARVVAPAPPPYVPRHANHVALHDEDDRDVDLSWMDDPGTCTLPNLLGYIQ